MVIRDKLFIGGQWVAASGMEMIDVHHAGTGEVMGKVPAGTEEDIDAAVARGRDPFLDDDETAELAQVRVV